MRSLMIAGAVVLAGAVGVHAADLIVDEAPAVSDTGFVNSSMYVQLLGGAVQNLAVDYYTAGAADGSADTEFGYAIAGTVGVVVMDGLSIEGDVLHTSRDAADFDSNYYATTSVMANLKYTVDLNDTFSVYGAVGVGYVWGTEYFAGDTTDYNGFGAQVIAGVGAKLTENISGVAEYRYQTTFDKSNFDGPADFGLIIPTGTVLAGLKLSF